MNAKLHSMFIGSNSVKRFCNIFLLLFPNKVRFRCRPECKTKESGPLKLEVRSYVTPSVSETVQYVLGIAGLLPCILTITYSQDCLFHFRVHVETA